MLSRKQIFYSVVLFLAGIGIGYFFGLTGRSETPLIQTPEITELFSVSGTVQEIRGNIIILETRIPSGLRDISAAKREVVVTERTQILEGALKSPEEIVKELQAHQKNTAGSAPHSLFAAGQSLLLGDIKPGSNLIVESDENIKQRARFEAKIIIVQPPE